MADEDNPLSDDEKVRIASSFLLHSPPGELTHVFNDVRVLINDDYLLKQACSAFVKYNQDQLTPVKVENSNFPAIISEFNYLGDDRYLDPRTKVSFKYDHLRREAIEYQAYEVDSSVESWRKAMEDAFTAYCSDHFKNGTCSVFAEKIATENSIIKITCCLEEHDFQSKNFYTGCFRSIWILSIDLEKSRAELAGNIKFQVHYYEDGNIQLLGSRQGTVNESITVKSEEETAAEIIALVEDSENEYQVAILQNYSEMSDVTFKALRRQLPVTRTKIDWQKILTFKKLGTELRHH